MVLVAGFAAAWGYSAYLNSQTGSHSISRVKLKAKLAKAEPKKPFTMLLLGADLRGGDTAWRTDTIILAKIDPEKKKAWMVSIPRDTRVEIPGHGTQKINAAHFIGGPELVVDVVQELTGQPVNHYLEVDFHAFRKVVNGLGGVWIDVDVPINDRKAARHNIDQRGSKIDPGYQKLDGDHALTYVRSRNFPDADFTRMKHQQEFFKAIAKQASSPGNLLKIPGIIAEVARYTTTDLTVQELLSIAQSMRGIEGENLQTATLQGEWRSPYVYIDEADRVRLMSAFADGRNLDDTATPAAQDVAGVVPGSVTVTVRNGGGQQGAATSTAEKLQAKGFSVQEVGNTKKGDFPRTLVVYNTNESAARAVAAALPSAEVVQSGGRYTYPTEVLVVIGADSR